MRMYNIVWQSLTHSVDFENRLIDTEVFRVVEQAGLDIEGLRFSEIPETEAAVVAFQGKYSRIGDINRYIYHWIVKNSPRKTTIRTNCRDCSQP